MNDIDLNGSESDQWIPMTTFAGTFDGNYHSIKNMYMDTNQYDVMALFTEVTKEGTVKNLKLENCYFHNYYCDVTNDSYYANNAIASICNINYGIITNIWVTGQLKGTIPEDIAGKFKDNTRARTVMGGIVGLDNRGIITNCVNQASIEGKGLAPVDDYMVGAFVSGICYGNNGIIYNCYNTGNIKAEGYNQELAAGIAGYSGASVISQIINCYNVGNIESSIVVGKNRRGAIVCESTEQNNMINCHYLNTISTTVNLAGTTAQPESTMKSEAFVQTLGGAYVKDETNINNGYPILNWQLK